MSQEPKLLYCTERTPSEFSYLDIECRFSDGQKFTAIQVDSEFPELAKLIVKLLNEEAMK